MTQNSGAVSQRGASDSPASPYVIGLTGPIASGKSTIAEMLRDRGAEVIDADRVYRSLVSPGSELWRRVVERFGSSVVGPDGEIARPALAELVFDDPEALADLDRITHPTVVAEIRDRIARSSAPVVVIEAVKLVQSGLASDVDELWLITADPEMRLGRLMTRTGMDEAAARARIAAAPDTVPGGVEVAVVIDNSDDLAATSSAVADAWRAARSLAAQEKHKHLTLSQKEHS
jgi:dephospho-CoA kinase